MHDIAPSSNGDTEPGWKRILRWAFLTGFVVLWFGGVTLFFTMVNAHNRGESTPSATHTVPFTQHANTKYITPAEKARIALLARGMLVGGVSEIGFGLLLFTVFRVNVFRDKP